METRAADHAEIPQPDGVGVADAQRADLFREAARIAGNVSLFGPGGVGRLSAEQVRDRIVQELLQEAKQNERRNSDA